MSRAVLEPAIPASELLQTHALELATNGIGLLSIVYDNTLIRPLSLSSVSQFVVYCLNSTLDTHCSAVTASLNKLIK